MSMKKYGKSKQAMEDYVKSLINRRDVLQRQQSSFDRDLAEVEQKLRDRYNDPNYDGKIKVRATLPRVQQENLIGERVQKKLDQIRLASVAAQITQEEETAIEVTAEPNPEITGLNIDVLLKVVRASIGISDCFFEGTTKEDREKLLSDIEKADVRYR